MKNSSFRFPLRTVIIYAVTGFIWILLSDRFLGLIAIDVQHLTSLQTYKGWIFVLASSFLIYTLLFREFKLLNKALDERIKAEETVIKERDLLKRINDTIPIGLTLVDSNGNITSANHQAEKILGLKRDKITQRTYNASDWKITDFHGGPFPVENLPFSLVSKTRQPVFDVQHAIEWKDGNRVLLSINASPLFSNGGDFDGMVASIEDITEKALSEEALRESEARWQSYVSDAPNVIFTVDKDFKITFINYTLPGYLLEDVLGVSIFNFLPEESKDIARITIDKVFATGEKQSYEALGYGIHGKPAWYSTSVGPIKKDGKVYSLIFVATDITERRRVEEALRISEDKFAKVFQASPDIIVLTSLDDGQLVEVNERLKDATGYTPEEIIGKRTGELQFWVDPAERDRYTALLMRDGRVRDLEVKFRIKSGEVRDTLLSGEIIELENGKYILGVIRDITERNRAEEKLLASEVRYRRLFEAAKDGILILDANTGNINDVNPFLTDVLGYSAEELLGKKLWEISPFKDIAANQETFEHLKRQEYVRYENLPLQSKDGRSIQVEFVSNLYMVGDRQVIQCNIRDITQRKLIEIELSASEERYRLATEAGGVAAWQVTPPDMSVDSGGAIEKLIGYEKGKIKDWYSVTHTDDRQHLRNLWDDIFAGKFKRYDVEHRMLHKDGSVRWVLICGEVHLDADGRVLKVVGTTQDITENRLAEENISRRAQDLATLLKISQELAVTLDLRTILQLTTDRITELTELKNSAIYLLEGETLRLWATTPPLPPEFPEEFRNAPLADHPHIRRVISTGMSVFLPDTATADFTPAERAISEMRGLHSILYLPLITRTKVLGTLIVTTTEEPRTLSEAEINLCTTVTNLAALAIENAMLYDDIRQSNSELNVINKTILTSTSDLDLNFILNKVMEDALNVVGLEGGTICLVNPDDTFELAAERGATQETIDDLTNKKIKIGDCLCGNCAKECKPLILPTKEAVLAYATRETLRGEDIRFHAAFPFVVGEKCVGVLCVFTRTDKKPLQRNLKLLETITTQISLSIENARLYGEIKEHVKRLQEEILNRKRSAVEIKKMNEQLRALAVRLQTIREEERTTIAREIHDELGQMLTGLKYELMWIEKRIDPGQDDMRSKVAEIQILIDSTIKTVRKISAELRPGILDLGLAAAIEWQAGEFRRRTGIGGRTEINGTNIQMKENTSTQVFRIFQEILTNIMRHANATEVDIILKRFKNDLVLIVSDNGKGMHPGTGPDGQSLGLLGIQERAIIFGGTLSITSTVNKGTTVEVLIPTEHSKK